MGYKGQLPSKDELSDMIVAMIRQGADFPAELAPETEAEVNRALEEGYVKVKDRK